MTAPVLVFAWGNPSRGDDALGPLLAEQLAHHPGVDTLSDYQLQPEHALDLMGRERVLFVDASITATPPFEVTSLQAARDASFTTHGMSPEALMQVYAQMHGTPPPPCTLLAIRGDCFDLGAAPSTHALAHLGAAAAWCQQWLSGEAPHA